MPDWPQARLASPVEAGFYDGVEGVVADELLQLVKARRGELGLSYQALAAASVDAESASSVSSGWLHRLETGAPVIPPSAETLAALAVGLRLDLARLQEAAAAQFFGLRLRWETSGEAADLLAMMATLPEPQRLALVELIRVMAKSR
jgi:transcriptional regulator with XRE-family HTH domain